MSQTVTITVDDRPVEDFFTETEYAPLALRKVVNQIRTIINPEVKDLPGPMFYTYARKGMLDGQKWPVGTSPRIQRDAAIAWTVKYLSKNMLTPATTEAE
jgi:hypothetical protein